MARIPWWTISAAMFASLCILLFPPVPQDRFKPLLALPILGVCFVLELRARKLRKLLAEIYHERGLKLLRETRDGLGQRGIAVELRNPSARPKA